MALAGAARAALWMGDAAGAADDLAALDGSGVHGPAVDADRKTIRAGIAALEGRPAEAIADLSRGAPGVARPRPGLGRGPVRDRHGDAPRPVRAGGASRRRVGSRDPRRASEPGRSSPVSMPPCRARPHPRHSPPPRPRRPPRPLPDPPRRERIRFTGECVPPVETDPIRLAGPFPADFTWGFAASSYQIEGATPRTVEGRRSGTRSPASRAPSPMAARAMSPATTTIATGRTYG